MEGLSSYNVTVEALHVVSEVYSFCQHQLGKYNVLLPEFDQVVSIVTSTFGFILTFTCSSSTAVFILYKTFSFRIQLCNHTLFAGFALYWLLYSDGYFQWFRGLVYGFGKFSLVIFTIYGLIYVFQYFLDNTPTHSNKSTTRTRNY
ncbi:unnamed protein product [Rhizopus stolonifer]